MLTDADLGGHSVSYIESNFRRRHLQCARLTKAESDHIRKIIGDLFKEGTVRMTNFSNEDIHFGKRFAIA